MLHPSTPGPPLFALTFLNASITICFGIANGLLTDFGSFTGLLPAHRRLTTDELPGQPSPLLQTDYRPFLATTRRSAREPRIGTRPLTVAAAWSTPSRHEPNRAQAVSTFAFRRSLRKPQIRFTPPLCRTPPGQYMGTRQTSPRIWNAPRF